MKSLILITFLFFTSFLSLSQNKQINNYKYIIVKEKFDFLKQKDQYQTSSLVKFLLKKNGFTVYLESENLPKAILENPCNAMIADVREESSMFKSKLTIFLKDCYNKVLYTSKEGESREKDYKKGYQQAIRNAHSSMGDVIYDESKNKTKIDTLLETKEEIKTEEFVISKLSTTGKNTISKKKTLYAQVKENGFQLINLKPEVVFIILKTTLQEVFLIKDKNGILYKKNTLWIAEYYKEGVLVTEEYQIKF